MKFKPIEIKAQFVLDQHGKPVFDKGQDHKHYKIHLSIKGMPEHAESVSYTLHSTYYNPVREIFKKERGEQFQEEITSYGDFDIKAVVSGFNKETQSSLSNALETSIKDYETTVDHAAIDEALKEIKDN